MEQDKAKTVQIRKLNNRLRVEHEGGRLCLTRGVLSLGGDAINAIIEATKHFDGFNEENDPYHEHDCAVVAVGDRNVIWKIDYFDLSMNYHSPDPCDPAVTTRVLTIMLPGEY